MLAEIGKEKRIAANGKLWKLIKIAENYGMGNTNFLRLVAAGFLCQLDFCIDRQSTQILIKYLH